MTSGVSEGDGPSSRLNLFFGLPLLGRLSYSSRPWCELTGEADFLRDIQKCLPWASAGYGDRMFILSGVWPNVLSCVLRPQNCLSAVLLYLTWINVAFRFLGRWEALTSLPSQDWWIKRAHTRDISLNPQSTYIIILLEGVVLFNTGGKH